MRSRLVEVAEEENVDKAPFDNEPKYEEARRVDSATDDATIDPEDIPQLDEDVTMDEDDKPAPFMPVRAPFVEARTDEGGG